MTNSRYWYVATVYTRWPGIKLGAYAYALERLKVLVEHGVPAFSPIVHTHPLEAEAGIARPHSFWMNLDRPFFESACGLIVCCSEGWRDSKGIAEEIHETQLLNKPIHYWHDALPLPWADLIETANHEVVA